MSDTQKPRPTGLYCGIGRFGGRDRGMVALLLLLSLSASPAGAHPSSSAASGAPEQASAPSARYDVTSFRQEKFQTLSITTDLGHPIPVGIEESKIANDVECKSTDYSSDISVKPGSTYTEHLHFSRQGSPSVALYQWNICFVIHGVTYKAWRGFDPGPGATLTLSCMIGLMPRTPWSITSLSTGRIRQRACLPA